MGQVLKREYGSKRAMIAALLATGVLAALLALTGLAAPVPAYAAELQGSGTEDDPTLIYNTDDLIAWCNKLRDMKSSEEHNQHARLMADLVDDGCVNDKVITDMNYPDFQAAEFDGNNHLIELRLNSHGGMFETGGMPLGVNTEATIRNINFVGTVSNSVSDSRNAGTVFARVGTPGDEEDDRRIGVWNCTNQATVHAYGNAGGFIGSYHDEEHGYISVIYCANFGYVTSENAHAGGMAGSVEQVGGNRRTARVLYCSNNGSIMSQGGTFENRDGEEFGGSAGGLMGYLSYGSINNFTFGRNYNQGAIESQGGLGYAGGLVGYLDTAYKNGEISGCYNTGLIKAQASSDQAGGIVGRAQAGGYGVWIAHSLTSRESMPAGAMDDSYHNGTVVDEAQIGSAFAVEYLDDHNYVLDNAGSYTHSGLPVFTTTGVGESFTVTLVSPVAGKVSYADAYWNTAVSPDALSAAAYAPEGYRLAYWTSEAPDAGSGWSKPPEEFLGIVYGDVTLYAYCVPATANVKFDLNAPKNNSGKYVLEPMGDKGSMPNKTIAENEPVGALPVCYYTGTPVSDGCSFLGWATEQDGSLPTAEWISESSTNLYDYMDEESQTVTLFAQWGEEGLPAFEILRQPEDCTLSAAAGVPHDAWFDFATSFQTDTTDDFETTLQRKLRAGDDWEDVCSVGHNATQYAFDIESSDEACYDYRFKIEYRSWPREGTVYTSSANIVLNIPQSEAEAAAVVLKGDGADDEVLGTHTYDVSGKITSDLERLMDESVPGGFAHLAWIEGGPDNILPANGTAAGKQYVDNARAFTLENRHLEEGQTYTLCVSRVFDDYYRAGRYQGESEPYRVQFTVPRADDVPASVTPVRVTDQPVVQGSGDAAQAVEFEANYSAPVNGTFNLAADAQWTRKHAGDVDVQWQCKLQGGGWTNLPDDFFAKDGKGKPIAGQVWSDDRTAARLHATLNAAAELDGARFRVLLSTPPSPVDTASEQSEKDLDLFSPEVTNLQANVNDDIPHVSVTWDWMDGAGSVVPSDGFLVLVQMKDGEDWSTASAGRVYTRTYDADLVSDKAYRVIVRADVDGLEGRTAAPCEFKTAYKKSVSLTWPASYGMMRADGSPSNLDVDYDWSDYNDGHHAARYQWYLCDELDSPKQGLFDEFMTTETDTVRLPDDFDNAGRPWDPRTAQWAQVVASVWTLDDEGHPADMVDGTRATSTALPIIHETTAPRDVRAESVGSHSAKVCWTAPAQGTAREYLVRVGDGIGKVVSAKRGETAETTYEVKVDGLANETSYALSVSTNDARLSDSTAIQTAYGRDFTTLAAPAAGTWTVESSKSAYAIGETLHFTSTYAANSGTFTKAELQWYSWGEGDSSWRPEGQAVTLEGEDIDRKTWKDTFERPVDAGDYGRQWKAVATLGTPDETVSVSTNIVTIAVVPQTPDAVCGVPTPTSIPVSWTALDDVDGYWVKCAKLGADGNPASSTTYSLSASSLTPDQDGKLHYEVANLQPETRYQVSVAAFAHGVNSAFSAATTVTTSAVPDIEAPVFSQAPKSTWVEAGAEATFTAQASVDGAGAVSYAWQRKGVGEQGFSPLASSEKYVMSEEAGVARLTVKDVGIQDVGAAFRCVATRSEGGQTADAVSAAAYLTVTPAAPTDAKAWATGPTTGEVSWTANGAVRRFVVTHQRLAPPGAKEYPKYSKVVTIADDATEGWCQIDGLEPGLTYTVELFASPQAGFRSSRVYVTSTIDTPPACTLDSATVTMSPDQAVVEPGTPVTFSVATNADGKPEEELAYRWQRNTFGGGWYDVDGGTEATLSVTAPDGGAVEGYRCIVTSTTTRGDAHDRKTVTSDVKLLATNVPVEQPVRLAAEPGTDSARLSWAGDDARPVTYEVEYAQGSAPVDDAWMTVENVGASTSCDVEGLTPNTVYSWRVRAVVRDGLQSDWALAETFTTLEESSALATVTVTPRWGTAVAGDGSNGVEYTAMTNLDDVATDESLSYQWQQSATGDEWVDMDGQTSSTFWASAANPKPCSWLYRCVVTASKDDVPLKTITSEPVGFVSRPKVPAGLAASSVTAAAANLSWTNGLNADDGLSYRVFWRASGTADWQSANTGREASYALSSLMPATTYEWYVQVMNGGAPSVRSAASMFVTQSLSPDTVLTRVVVSPVDQAVEAGEQATFAAYTNVDDMASATRTYKWETCDLGKDPDDPATTWTEVTAGTATGNAITLPENTDGYVRCTVTYAPPVNAFAPLSSNPVTSENKPRVRIAPTLPSNLEVDANALGQTSAKLSWNGDESRTVFDVVYRPIGETAWSREFVGDGKSITLDNLAPGTMYEWGVRSVAYADSDDPLPSGWVAGSPFATERDFAFSKVEVAPSTPSVMAGTEDKVTLTATTDADTAKETLTYQWQSKTGSSDWADVAGAKEAELEVSAQDMSVGLRAYRCEVTAARDSKEKTLESNESIVTAMPAAPTGLTVSDIHRLFPDDPNHTNVAATFCWTWGKDPVPEGVAFEVGYRQIAGQGVADPEWKSETFEYDGSMEHTTKSLDDEGLTYQWRVRVVQNGVASPWSEVDTFNTTLKEPEELNWVEVTPSDKLVGATDSVTLKATTNVDGKENKGALAYRWERRELTVDPRKAPDSAWTTIAGTTSDTITLSPDEQKPTNNKANLYVRCRVTRTINGVASDPVTSNPARVRVEPLPPHDLRTSIYSSQYGDSGVDLYWGCDDLRKTSDSVLGFEVSYRMVGANEWEEVPWVASSHRDNDHYRLSSLSARLDPGATYEWRVRTVLNNSMKQSWGSGGPHTEWVDGSAFTMPKVAATPAAAAAVVGSGRTITFAVTSNAVVHSEGTVTYQWQRKAAGSTTWNDLKDETNSTLSIVANDATAAEASRYRCVVKVPFGYNNSYTRTTNEVACTLAPVAPTSLSASNIESDKAKLAWQWDQGTLSSAATFNVSYREAGAKEWTTATVADNSKEFTPEGLKPETVYEWHVQAVQNGVESLPSDTNLFVTASEHPALKLESVAVEPADQEVAPDAKAKLTAATNLDEWVDTSTSITYEWQKRALDSNPDDPDVWKKINGAESRVVELEAGASGYVRCKATYDGVEVLSNEARVRVQPGAAPSNLKVDEGSIDDTTATLSWDGAPNGGDSFALSYRAVGTDEWMTATGLKASPYEATGLAPGTKYEWRMCSVSADGLTSAWVPGPAFATTSPDGELGSVVVTPPSATAVAGDAKLVDDFLAAVSGVGEGQALAYQWQVCTDKASNTWANLPGQTGERTHLSVANLEAGVHTLRCVVTATAPGGKSETAESNEAELTLSPMAARNLVAQNVQDGAATLTWAWAWPGAADSFKVRYREEGSEVWTEVPAGKIDAAYKTCTIDGLAPGTPYEWQVQAMQGGQTSVWSELSGFVTLSNGSLKIARVWPPDVIVAANEQATFAAFTNRGNAEDVSYEWQYRALGSLEDAWEAIPHATGRVVTLDAGTIGYVRCVAMQATPATPAAEVVPAVEVAEAAPVAEVAPTTETPKVGETGEVAKTAETSATTEANEALAANESFGANEALEADVPEEMLGAAETNEAPAVPEIAETLAAPAPVVVYSNEARVRVTPSAPENLAVGEVGFRDAALSWGASDMPDSTFTLAYRAVGTDEWTEAAGLTAPAHKLDGLAPGTRYEWRVQTVVVEEGDALASAWAYGDSFTTQTMKTYPVTAGSDGTWKPGQPGLSFTVDAPRDKFLSLVVDGAELVQDVDYALAADGMTVTLSPDYLAKLAVGKHALVAMFTDGTASASFTVAPADPGPTPNPPDPPNPPGPTPTPDPPTPTPLPDDGGKKLAPTGDPLTVALPLIGCLALASACAAIMACRWKRRRP